MLPSFSTNLRDTFFFGKKKNPLQALVFFFLKMKTLAKTSFKALFSEGGHTTTDLIMSLEEAPTGGPGLLTMPFKCHFIKLSFVIIIIVLVLACS